MATCNEHGVYQADETLELKRNVKGWRGRPVAEIDLANLGTHWIWSTGFQMHTGDMLGHGSPLMDLEPSRFMSCRAPSRQAAIDAACAELRKSLSNRAEGGDGDARAVMAWLETLAPDQLDLFGAAA